MENYLQGISPYSSDSIKLLEKVVVKRFGVSIVELRSRLRIASKARYVMFYLLNKNMLYSTVMIGRLYNRDHTTVIAGIRWVRSNKVRTEEADKIFLHCLKNGDTSEEKTVDKLSINPRIVVDTTVDNVVDKLPYDEGAKSCPTISSKYPQKKGRNPQQ